MAAGCSAVKEASYWVAEGGRARCTLCPHGCLVADGRAGICRVRRAEGGKLYAWGYGRVSSAHLDPVEKKPLHHFFPGRMIFSVGGWGCNFRCSFCQNWTISQQAPGAPAALSPEDIVSAASSDDSVGVAYTYNEPLVGFEFVRDCSALARRKGLKNVLVTNGYICPEPAAELLPLVDALNIDVKSMRESFYSTHCGGTIRPVLDFCVQAKAAGCHVEITNLVIPGLNDSDEEASSLAGWISSTLGPSTPLHLSAYHPQYEMNAPPTPPAVLERRRLRCLESLGHVYVGNVASPGGANTVCLKCGGTLVRRRGYAVDASGLNGGRCRACGSDSGIVVS